MSLRRRARRTRHRNDGFWFVLDDSFALPMTRDLDARLFEFELTIRGTPGDVRLVFVAIDVVFPSCPVHIQSFCCSGSHLFSVKVFRNKLAPANSVWQV